MWQCVTILCHRPAGCMGDSDGECVSCKHYETPEGNCVKQCPDTTTPDPVGVCRPFSDVSAS
jgi:hypothetical protein